MRTIIITVILIIAGQTAFSQRDTTKTDTTKKEIIIKDNWSKKKKEVEKKNTDENIIFKEEHNNKSKYERTTNIGIGNKSFRVKETYDTTIISLGHRDLIISEHRGNTRIFFKKRNRRNRYFRGHWTGFEIGLNDLTNADYSIWEKNGINSKLNLDLSKSIAVNLNLIQYDMPTGTGNSGFVTGLGLSWYNFRFDEDITVRDDGANGLLVPVNLDKDWNVKKSKLTMSYLTVPLMYEIQGRQYSSFFISAGVVGGIKLGSHTKVKYKKDGYHKEKNRDDFNIRPYKLDASFRMGFRSINLWGRYSLFPLFKENEGPELTPYSFGVAFSFN